MFKFYVSLLDRHPIVVKSTTSGLMYGLGDWIAQFLESINHVDTGDLSLFLSFSLSLSLSYSYSYSCDSDNEASGDSRESADNNDNNDREDSDQRRCKGR
jgi:hypothetical protein